MLTRDQRYAGDALVCVQKVKAGARAGVDKDEYRALAQEFPVLVRTAGLVQALTFVQSRNESHKQLLEDVAHTLKRANGKDLVDASRTVPLPEYLRLTEQVIDVLQWYKRLAQIELKKPAGA